MSDRDIHIQLGGAFAAICFARGTYMVELTALQEVVRGHRQSRLFNSALPPHLGHFSDALADRRLKRTASVFALPYSHGGATADWAKIVSFGRYRFPFSLIEELAKVLAPEVVRTGVVPVILPFHINALDPMTWSNPLVKSLTTKGVLLYARVSVDGS